MANLFILSLSRQNGALQAAREFHLFFDEVDHGAIQLFHLLDQRTKRSPSPGRCSSVKANLVGTPEPGLLRSSPTEIDLAFLGRMRARRAPLVKTLLPYCGNPPHDMADVAVQHPMPGATWRKGHNQSSPQAELNLSTMT